jgi:hypothetical protein
VPIGFSGYIVSFASAAFDDNSFWNVGTPTDLVIPVTDPVISRVQVTANCVWSPAAAGSQFHLTILKSGGASQEATQSANGQDTSSAPNTNHYLNVSLIEDVVPGDVFTLRAWHLLGAANVTLARANMALTVLG